MTPPDHALAVDVYVSCWNNADMLGFFFRHYDPIARRYVVFDDGSTDESLEILAAHPKVEVRELPRAGPSEARTMVTLSAAETCWRETSADADWVIMCDIDEHLCHPDFAAYLRGCKAEGITIIPALGYQMLSDTMPATGRLCDQVTLGAPWRQMSKMNVFSPRDVDRLNYTPGRHQAAPVGNIVAPERDELLLLHFKYLDLERVVRRHEAASARLGHADRKVGWGHRWGFSREELRADWEQFLAQAVDLSGQTDHWRTHTEPRWWEAYRKSARTRRSDCAFSASAG